MGPTLRAETGWENPGSRMMKSELTMAARTLRVGGKMRQFAEQDAARLCVHCKEPFFPRACQIRRCSGCGAEGKNGRLACECAKGRPASLRLPLPKLPA